MKVEAMTPLSLRQSTLTLFLVSLLLFTGFSTTLSHAQDSGYHVIYINDAAEIIALDPLSGQQTILLDLNGAQHPAYGLNVSPSGDYLATYVRSIDEAVSGFQYHLYISRIPNGELLLSQPLLPAGFAYPSGEPLGDPNYELTRALGEVAWSPDGSRVAFISGQNGSADVFVFDTTSQTLTQLSNQAQTAAFMHWNPSGTRLVFSELNSFGDGGGYLAVGHFVASIADGSVQPIGLPEPANISGFAEVGWLDDQTLVYSPLNFVQFGASGLFSLDLNTLQSTEHLPARIALNVPVLDASSRTVAFVVPEAGDGGLVPGAYLWQLDAPTPTLLETGVFYTVEQPKPALFQFESPRGSLITAASDPALLPLPQNDFGAYVSPNLSVDAVALVRGDGLYISRISVDDASLVWNEETQVPIWSPDGSKFYTFGFTEAGAGLVEIDVVSRSLRLLDDRMAISSPRAVAP